MKRPIAIKSLGIDDVEQLPKQLEVYAININSDTEEVTVQYRIVLLSPAGNPVKTLEQNVYRRFNSKKGDRYSFSKIIKNDNLKFDQLRGSQIGQMIEGMIADDIKDYTGPQSIEQLIITE